MASLDLKKYLKENYHQMLKIFQKTEIKKTPYEASINSILKSDTTLTAQREEELKSLFISWSRRVREPA